MTTEMQSEQPEQQVEQHTEQTGQHKEQTEQHSKQTEQHSEKQAKQTNRQTYLTIGLLLIYLTAVIAVILFKFPFRGDPFGSTRVIELIPFYVSEIQDVDFFRSNLVYNVLFFIPFGIFVCLLKPEWSFWKKVTPVFLLSLLFEVSQFVLGIGISDITDLITNTSGGAAGIGLYHMLRKLLKKKTHAIILVIAAIMIVVMLFQFVQMGRTMIR
jgi:glycopeptide antibiotics resistance protein